MDSSFPRYLLLGSLLLSLGCTPQIPLVTPPPPLGDAVRFDRGFSFRPPLGWQRKQPKGQGLPLFSAGDQDRFIFIYTDQSALTLESYVDENISALTKTLPQFTAMKPQQFITRSGVKGIEIVTDSLWLNRPRRQVYYFFGRDLEQVIFVCEGAPEQWDTYRPVCSQSIGAFIWHDAS